MAGDENKWLALGEPFDFRGCVRHKCSRTAALSAQHFLRAYGGAKQSGILASGQRHRNGNRWRSQCGPRSIHGCVAGVGQTEGSRGITASFAVRHRRRDESRRGTQECARHAGRLDCPLRHNVCVKKYDQTDQRGEQDTVAQREGASFARKRQLRMWRTHSCVPRRDSSRRPGHGRAT